MNEIIIGANKIQPKSIFNREVRLITEIKIGEDNYRVDTAKICTKDIISDCEWVEITDDCIWSDPADKRNLAPINHGKFRVTTKALLEAHTQALSTYVDAFKARGYVLIDEVSSE